MILADRAYTDYQFEDDLYAGASIQLWLLRKRNSKRPLAAFVDDLQRKMQKVIQTSFSVTRQIMPGKIHAMTAQGFELKVVLLVLAYSPTPFL